MAEENILLDDGNFCMAPQVGTLATIDLSDQALKIKNLAGSQIGLYTLSSSITNTLLSLAYVGPIDYTGSVDKSTFFTMEKVSSTQCQIKRWELNTTAVTLDLKSTITKTTGGAYYYDAKGMAVEHYRRLFSVQNPGGINYLNINSSSNISSGMRLFLGPSSDLDNTGAVEYVTVDYVVGSTVYLTSNIVYQYVDGDNITFYKNLFLISGLGYAGDTSKGMFKLNPDTGAVLETDNKGFYQGISACKWSSYVQAVACVSSTNMLFVRPYDYYQNWKSMFLNNVEDDEATVFTVYDIEFDDYEVYKLMLKVTLRSDSGVKTTYSWAKYNYRQDTLLPYTNSIDLYTTKARMIGDADTTTLEIQVRDQFGVGLLNVETDVDVASGDGDVVLDPIDGKVTTDSSGYADVGYTSGNTYEGMTRLTIKCAGGFTGHGSQYVWNSIYIRSEQDVGIDTKLFQKGDVSKESYAVRQIAQQVQKLYKIFCKSFFTTTGGNWINPSPYAGEVGTYLPTLAVGYNDGPAQSFERGWDPGDPGAPSSLSNNIKQVLNFESWSRLKQADEFESLKWIKQIKEKIATLQIDQLKLSQHTYWVSGIAYDYLWTQISFNQFVFVEDAIPKFWSEKNPVDTDIWIRLRPFAYDLNPGTVKFMVRELSYAGDTGYRDWTSYCTITSFDAGGGIDGLDILCNPPANFHHDALIYVHIEVYDSAPTPNYIYTDYWFTVIPDYRFPYLDNLDPSREQTNVPVDSNIYFEVKDLGIGVDIDSLEVLVNSRKVVPDVVKIDDSYYEVTYNPVDNLYYGKEITVSVRVSDLSENRNTLIDSYRFFTVESSGVLFVPVNPLVCKRGMSRFQDVSFLVLGLGDGVDLSSLRVQIHQLDVRDKVRTLPVIYRIS